MRLPYAAVEFTKGGSAADRNRFTAAADTAAAAGATDVLVIAHGWNTGITGAEHLFGELTDNMDRLRERDAAADPRLAELRLAVVGVLWPAIRWAEDDEIAGGGLSVGEPSQELEARIREVVPNRRRAAALLRQTPSLKSSDEALAEFVKQLRAMLPAPADVADDDPIPEALRSGDPRELLRTVAQAERDLGAAGGAGPVVDDGTLPPGAFPDPLAGGGTVGTGFDFADLNPFRAARMLLNLTTYFTMKERAGNVGAAGVGPLLDTLADRLPGVRLHLAGHSFGARAVSMAGASTGRTIGSVSLLQGAFSHVGLAPGTATTPRGAFHGLVDGGHVRGPIVVTHTHNDRAVRLAYAVASRLAGQASAGLGDAEDPYGGLGANGALGLTGTRRETLGDESTRYGFTAGQVYNLLGDHQITGHGDVADGPVANAVLQAVVAARP